MSGRFSRLNRHTPLDGERRRSAAAEAIIAAARANDDLPLILVCGGPLTNVADALSQAPDIAERMRLCWVGGAIEPDAAEYNRDTDIDTMRFVFDNRALSITQFPVEAYRRCATSVAELESGLVESGAVGEWLWERYEKLPIPAHVEIDPVWPLGDSLPLIVTALSSVTSEYHAESDVPRRTIFTDIDIRLLVGDLWARLRLHDRGAIALCRLYRAGEQQTQRIGETRSDFVPPRITKENHVRHPRRRPPCG